MTRAIRALVDGLPVETLPIEDRGPQYGDGMFETCRVVDGRVPLWEFHRARLIATAIRLGIPQTNAVIGVWPGARILERDRARLRPGRIARGIIDALEARFGFPRSQ
jgi:branched-subunit amino acid aminotransferase/4-amino-4-deoxychorismate lyase